MLTKEALLHAAEQLEALGRDPPSHTITSAAHALRMAAQSPGCEWCEGVVALAHTLLNKRAEATHWPTVEQAAEIVAALSAPEGL